MVKLKRRLKVLAQNAWALVALVLLILSLPPIMQSKWLCKAIRPKHSISATQFTTTLHNN